MSKEKIVLFAPCLYCGGGTERVLVQLANALTDKYQIIIAVNVLGEKPLYKLDTKVEIKKFWFGKMRNNYSKNLLTKASNRIFGSLFLKSFLEHKIFEHTYLIISFSPAITNDCFKTKYRDKLISFEHWPFSFYDKHPKAQEQIIKNYPNLNKVVVLTKHEQNVYQSLGCDVALIPNALPFLPKRMADLSIKTVLSVGHFNHQKRRDLLIDAWKLVRQRHHDWQLCIVGEGEQEPDALKQIREFDLEDSVRVLPPTSNIEKHYEQASIFVLSSEFESFSLVLLEAKVSGLPCISFDVVCGPSELIRDQIDGYLIDFPDVKSMSERICTLIDNYELRKQFGKAAHQDAVSRFDPLHINLKWEKLIDELYD